MIGLTFSTARVKTSIGFSLGSRLLDQLHRVVEDALGDALLAVVHEAVDELAGQLRAEPGVRTKLGLAGGELPGHERQSCSTEFD